MSYPKQESDTASFNKPVLHENYSNDQIYNNSRSNIPKSSIEMSQVPLETQNNTYITARTHTPSYSQSSPQPDQSYISSVKQEYYSRAPNGPPRIPMQNEYSSQPTQHAQISPHLQQQESQYSQAPSTSPHATQEKDFSTVKTEPPLDQRTDQIKEQTNPHNDKEKANTSPSNSHSRTSIPHPSLPDLSSSSTTPASQLMIPIPPSSSSNTIETSAVLAQDPSIPASALTLDNPPPGIKPHITTTLWEDEGTLCFQVEAKGICVARREDNNMINGTKLLNVAGMSRGRRDGILKAEKNRHVVKVGAMHFKGVWIPYERAVTFASKEKIVDILYPLFVADIKALLYHPNNYARTALIMSAAVRKKEENQQKQREREEMMKKKQEEDKAREQQQMQLQSQQTPQVGYIPMAGSQYYPYPPANTSVMGSDPYRPQQVPPPAYMLTGPAAGPIKQFMPLPQPALPPPPPQQSGYMSYYNQGSNPTSNINPQNHGAVAPPMPLPSIHQPPQYQQESPPQQQPQQQQLSPIQQQNESNRQPPTTNGNSIYPYFPAPTSYGMVQQQGPGINGSINPLPVTLPQMHINNIATGQISPPMVSPYPTPGSNEVPQPSPQDQGPMVPRASSQYPSTTSY